MSQLERLTQAERMLAEVATAQDVRDVMQMASLAAEMARRVELGTASVNHALLIKAKAMRKLAEIVDEGQAKGEIAKKGDGGRGRPIDVPRADIYQPQPLPVPRQRLAEARQIRDAFTEDDLEELFTEATENDREMPTRAVVREAATRREAPARPAPQWSDDEETLLAQLRAGKTVVVNMRDGAHPNLITWAEQHGMFVRIDRRSEWGNPFEMPADGDRNTVIHNYAEHYLPHKPSLLKKIETLHGKALGCWCAPADCHGDVLLAIINGTDHAHIFDAFHDLEERGEA